MSTNKRFCTIFETKGFLYNCINFCINLKTKNNDFSVSLFDIFTNVKYLRYQRNPNPNKRDHKLSIKCIDFYYQVIVFLIILVALKRAGWVDIGRKQYSLLGAGVLGDSLGSLRDGVLGQLTGQEEPDSSLDLPGGDGGPLVVVGKTAGLSSDALKEIIDKGVHDAHGLGGDTGIGVHLLENLVDVDGIRFLPLLVLLLLVTLGNSLGGFSCSLGSFS